MFVEKGRLTPRETSIVRGSPASQLKPLDRDDVLCRIVASEPTRQRGSQTGTTFDRRRWGRSTEVTVNGFDV